MRQASLRALVQNPQSVLHVQSSHMEGVLTPPKAVFFCFVMINSRLLVNSWIRLNFFLKSKFSSLFLVLFPRRIKFSVVCNFLQNHQPVFLLCWISPKPRLTYLSVFLDIDWFYCRGNEIKKRFWSEPPQPELSVFQFPNFCSQLFGRTPGMLHVLLGRW